MKLKVLFSIIFLATWQGLAWGQESACAEEELHPFWAQEYTGADLLREKLQKSTQWEVSDHLFQIWDSYEYSHGEKVSNLIASPHPSAPIPSQTPLDYIPFYNLNRKSEHYDSFMRCQEENSCPAYINISMGFVWLPKEGSNVFDLIGRTNMVAVTAAGNDDKFMDLIKRKYARNKYIIAVGNCGTDGNPYYDSDYAPEITICAPSGEILRSYDFAGNPTRFSGTSGAAPQVTAALAAFTAITGYSLNSIEAIEILKKTAIPHPRLPTQSNMGAGMLNTWKIGEIAFKLRELCQENKTCYADSLQSEDTFKFSVDKQSLIERISDMEKENMLKDLRKAALLRPFDGELWSLLANINHKKCLGKQAQYYHSLATRVEKTNRELLYEFRETERYSMLKYLSFSHEEITADLTELYFYLLEKEEGVGIEVLMELSTALIINEAVAFPQQEVLLEMLINHSKINDEMLQKIGGNIALNAKNIPAHEKLLLAITGHQKIERAGLGEIGIWVANNAENIPAHKKLLLLIIDHQKIDGASMGHIGRVIAFNEKNIPANEKLLLAIINHQKVDEVELGHIGKWVAFNAERVPSHEKFLLMIINNSKIGEVELEKIAKEISNNAENISAHEKLLQAIKSRNAFIP